MDLLVAQEISLFRCAVVLGLKLLLLVHSFEIFLLLDWINIKIMHIRKKHEKKVYMHLISFQLSDFSNSSQGLFDKSFE